MTTNEKLVHQSHCRTHLAAIFPNYGSDCTCIPRPPTKYETDAKGGPHPLSGVPQQALDAATRALTDAMVHNEHAKVYLFDDDELEPTAHAVLAAALEEMRDNGYL